MRRLRPVAVVLFLFVVAKLSFFFPINYWWDEAVYLLHAEFIASAGKVGLWEIARPPMIPLIVAPIVRVPFAPQIISLAIACGVLYLTYLLGRRYFSERVGLFAAIAIALTPSFFFFSGKVLTSIPALFFLLLAAELLARSRYFFSGLVFGLAVLTRFFSVFVAAGILVFWFVQNRKKIKESVRIGAGITVVALLFFVSYFLTVRDPFAPFNMQVWLTIYTGWMYEEGVLFYLKQGVWDNALILVGLVGAGVFWRKLLLIGFVPYLVFLHLTPHKELRLLLLVLPFLMVFTGALWQKRKWLMVCALVFLFFVGAPRLFSVQPLDYANQARIKLTISGEVAVTNPVYALGKQVKVVPLYYPLLNSSQLEYYRKVLPTLGAAIVSECDILCGEEDDGCVEQKNQFLQDIAVVGSPERFGTEDCPVVQYK